MLIATQIWTYNFSEMNILLQKYRYHLPKSNKFKTICIRSSVTKYWVIYLCFHRLMNYAFQFIIFYTFKLIESCNEICRANAMCENFKYFNKVVLQPKLSGDSLTFKINTKIRYKNWDKLQRWNVSMTLLDLSAAASGYLH